MRVFVFSPYVEPLGLRCNPKFKKPGCLHLGFRKMAPRVASVWVAHLEFGDFCHFCIISVIFVSFVPFLYHFCHFCIVFIKISSVASSRGLLIFGGVYKTDSLLRQSVCAMQGVSVEPSHSALWVPYFCSLHPCNSNERWGREDCTFKHLALWISIIYKWMNESNEQHPGQCIRLGCTTKLLLKTCKAAKYLSFIIFLKPMSC